MNSELLSSRGDAKKRRAQETPQYMAIQAYRSKQSSMDSARTHKHQSAMATSLHQIGFGTSGTMMYHSGRGGYGQADGHVQDRPKSIRVIPARLYLLTERGWIAVREYWAPPGGAEGSKAAGISGRTAKVTPPFAMRVAK
uniref:Uncharacterized protein n=1 Tax=Trichuris muris TaxID=70415 RepID=A0A5S6QDR5_TRIMR